MEFNVRDDRKIVEIWLTNEEKKDIALREALKPMVKQYKAKKYTVVYFESGEQELKEMTLALLIYNRKRIAENEIVEEKNAGSKAEILCAAG